VVGARVVEAGGDAAGRAQAEALFADCIDPDADYSLNDRRELVEQLATSPGFVATIACEGDEGERYLYAIAGGGVRVVELADSRDATRALAPRGKRSPSVTAKDPEAVDDLIAALAGSEEDEWVSADDDGGTAIPYRWPTRDALVHALARAAPRWRQRVVRVLAACGQQHVEAVVEAGRVVCVPLHVVADRPADVEAFYRVTNLAPPTDGDRLEVAIAASAPATRPPQFDPARPLTTGGKRQRSDAFSQVRAALRGRDPEPAIQALVAAVRDPANAGATFAELRRDAYRELAKHPHPAIADLFRWGLEHEPDDVVDTVIYVAWRQDALFAELPALAASYAARGDARTAHRIALALAEDA